MIHIDIVCVGKIRESYLKDAISEYSKRLSKYCVLNIVELPDEKLPNKLNDSLALEVKQKESNSILSHIKKDSYVIALDLRGQEFDSVSFSQKMTKLSINNSSITFIIGGSLGLSEKVLSSCNEKLCFSKLTFPHQLIRIFLLEQIYRSFKIANNETYHK